MTATPPLTAWSVLRMAIRWKITRTRPSAAAATMRAAITTVTQATAGMSTSSAQQLGDGAGVADRADRDLLDAGVGRGEQLGNVVELTDRGDPAGEDLVGCTP